ncbi:Polysaccharide biosynthesis protein [Candidatus Magnetomorum sp. HK-1]|nr:Polysaccharide biosynthesis protein [Candidatus Magnetomorum sp. HK-1]
MALASLKNSLLKNSRQTLSANIINQVVGTCIFLTVPNILTQTDYSQIVFINVLFTFVILSDFGMSFVYGRKMPSVYHKNDSYEILAYNQTIFWVRLITTFLISIVLSVIYYLKYHNSINAILIIFINPLLLLVNFFISQYCVKGNFSVYRNINAVQSICRLLIIPLSVFYMVQGFLIAQIMAAGITIKTIKEQVLLGFDHFDIQIIRKHFFEGIVLLANYFFWNQLLNCGRLYATMFYSDEVIAKYGLTNAGYSLLSMMIISIYIPVTIETLKIIQDDVSFAIDMLFRLIIKSSMLLFFVVISAIEISPFLFDIFFPKYSINFDILKYQLLSLIAFPLIATLGNIFTGLEQPLKLLGIYSISFLSSYLIMKYISEDYGIISAAISQFLGITLLGILLVLGVFICYRQHIKGKAKNFLKIIFVVFIPYYIYFKIRMMF